MIEVLRTSGVNVDGVALPTKRWEFEIVDVGRLKIDPSYHDPARYSEKRAAKIAKEWNDDKVGTLTISRRRDGIDIIIDGHHRVSAARLRDIKRLPAKVYYGLSKEEEADIFHGLSDAVRLMPIARYRAALVAGNAVAVAINETLTRRGVVISSHGEGPRSTKAIVTIETLQKAGVLDDVLTAVRSAWPEEPKALDSVVLQGVASFLVTYRADPLFDPARFRSVLELTPPSAIIRRTRDLATGRQSWLAGKNASPVTSWQWPRLAVLSFYNLGLRSNRLHA